MSLVCLNTVFTEAYCNNMAVDDVCAPATACEVSTSEYSQVVELHTVRVRGAVCRRGRALIENRRWHVWREATSGNNDLLRLGEFRNGCLGDWLLYEKCTEQFNNRTTFSHLCKFFSFELIG